MRRDHKEIKRVVREGYARVAKHGIIGCSSNSCCGNKNKAKGISKIIGYTDRDINAVPDGSNLGLGCGNPVAIASLKRGETVLDLGSGAGFDAFLAARKVGETGRVIGIDMTPEMIEKAEKNAKKGCYSNVEFRQGEIENLPVDNNSVDVIISNCVINLSPDKESVFKEAFRALRPGGRLMVSDLVLLKDLPPAVKESIDAYVSCIAGAVRKNKYLGHIRSAGFREVKVVEQSDYPLLKDEKMEEKDIKDSVVSIKVHARKP